MLLVLLLLLLLLLLCFCCASVLVVVVVVIFVLFFLERNVLNMFVRVLHALRVVYMECLTPVVRASILRMTSWLQRQQTLRTY